MFEVGQFLTNQFEVSRNAATIEIMATWTDVDDGAVYYIFKCRKVEEDHGHSMYSSWYYEDEVGMLSDGFLDKYFNIVEDVSGD